MIPRIVACIAVAVMGTTAIVGYGIWFRNFVQRWDGFDVELTYREMLFCQVSELLFHFSYVPIAILWIVCIAFAFTGTRPNDTT